MYRALTDLYGKKIALLLWFLNEERDTSAVVVRGTAYFQDGALRLHRGSMLPPLPLPLRMVWRATPVPSEYMDILGEVDFCIQGTVAELHTDLGEGDVLSRTA